LNPFRSDFAVIDELGDFRLSFARREKASAGRDNASRLRGCRQAIAARIRRRVEKRSGVYRRDQAPAAVQIGEQNRQRDELIFSNVIVKLDELEIHGEKLSFERRVFKPSNELWQNKVNAPRA
jgi:hypothetical protein